MHTGISVTNQLSGAEIFYDSFKDAIRNSVKNDLITIYEDLEEQMFVNKSINIVLAPGVIIHREKEALPLFVISNDGKEFIDCTITGLHIETK
ncbi:MAG: hypothetical protein LH629_07925 [Ignavibacteria bacterium]|nr:hypothetical protein [Ignavibacteria bacterium]